MLPARLIDTGAILAIVEADDHWHSACLEALQSVRIPLLTGEAVLTELFHLMGKKADDIKKTWPFIRPGAVRVRSIADSDLPTLRSLMVQYHDRPMDFADATLVHLPSRESLSLILTIDHDNFETDRIGGSNDSAFYPGAS
jgi:predicted nucleic acid-binding protein